MTVEQFDPKQTTTLDTPKKGDQSTRKKLKQLQEQGLNSLKSTKIGFIHLAICLLSQYSEHIPRIS